MAGVMRVARVAAGARTLLLFVPPRLVWLNDPFSPQSPIPNPQSRAIIFYLLFGSGVALRSTAPRVAVRSLATSSAAQTAARSFARPAATAGVFAAVAGFAAALAVTSAEPAKYYGGADWQKIKKEIEDLIDSAPVDYDDGSYGPVFVRLAWHSAGTYDKNKKDGGSNGGKIRHEPESKWGANAGLDFARSLLEPIKKKHPEITYADLFTFVGVVAIEAMGGPQIPWRPGRSDDADGKSSPPDGRLPDASQKEDHLRFIFYRMGFDDKDIVALSGAHTLGRCHTNRSGFSGPWTRVPTSFTNEFFRELTENTWTVKKWNGPKQYEDPTGELMMLESDLALIKDAKFKKYVEKYAKNQDEFFHDFAVAFAKLLELGVPFPAFPQ